MSEKDVNNKSRSPQSEVALAFRLSLGEALILLVLPLMLFALAFLKTGRSPAVTYVGYQGAREIWRAEADEPSYGPLTIPSLEHLVLDYSPAGLAIIENNCPDHYCLRQGRILNAGETLFCLPRQILIRAEGGEVEYDYVTPVY